MCIVDFSNNYDGDICEFWIFDALDLKQGPLYRLSHPKLNIGLTIHSTWLSTLERPPERTDYSVRKDYGEIVTKLNSPAITDLFEEFIYPAFGE